MPFQGCEQGHKPFKESYTCAADSREALVRANVVHREVIVYYVKHAEFFRMYIVAPLAPTELPIAFPSLLQPRPSTVPH
jgi:hypothetical protein